MEHSATAFVKAAIKNDRDFAEWALSVVYLGQTEDEQESRRTRWNNRRGFSAADAKILSDVAEQNARGGRTLQAEPDSTNWVRVLPKYASQIVDVVMRRYK